MSQNRERILVAMSGGVDSTVTAALLVRAGHEVIGATLRLCPGAESGIADAAGAAALLGIPHRVFDGREAFEAEVVAPFVAAYAAGRTPNPCIRCNRRIKFDFLAERARELGATALATGHYARLEAGPEGTELHAAADAARDQSYFLFAAGRERLPFLRFPLGGLTKTEVRAFAASIGLPNAGRRDSQDICFVPDGRYAALVAERRPEAVRPGAIVDRAGRVLGSHRGIVHFTVGQRKRLNISGQSEPLFVLKLDAAKAEVVVGPRAALECRKILVEDVTWLADPAAAAHAAVKVRSTRPPVPAAVTPLAGDKASVLLAAAEEAVAPGQACVFYGGSRVLGGGWIADA